MTSLNYFASPFIIFFLQNRKYSTKFNFFIAVIGKIYFTYIKIIIFIVIYKYSSFFIQNNRLKQSIHISVFDRSVSITQPQKLFPMIHLGRVNKILLAQNVLDLQPDGRYRVRLFYCSILASRIFHLAKFIGFQYVTVDRKITDECTVD